MILGLDFILVLGSFRLKLSTIPSLGYNLRDLEPLLKSSSSESVHGFIVGLMAVDRGRIRAPNSYVRMMHDAFFSLWTSGWELSILNVRRQNGQLVALRIASRLRVLFASVSVPQAKNNLRSLVCNKTSRDGLRQPFCEFR